MKAFGFAVLAAMIWGFVPLFEKLGLSKVEPLVGLFYRCVGVMIGLIILLAIMIKPSEIKSVNTGSAFLLILSGFLASFVAQIAFYHALKIGELSRIVPISGSYPFISFILGIVLLGESFSLPKLVGVIFVISGIFILKGN